MLNVQNAWRFADGDRTYVLNVDNLALYETDALTEALLDRRGKSREDVRSELALAYGTDVVIEALRTLQLCGFLPDGTEASPPVRKTVTALSVNVIQECNLGCTYCYGVEGEYKDPGRMDRQTGEATVEFLLSRLPDGQSGYLTFFGGEPLLNFSLIQHLVLYTERRCEELGKRIGFGMTTNGTMLTEAKQKFLREHKVSIQVSMDGTPEAQNSNRPYQKSGAPSYEQAIGMIKPWIQGVPTTARGTVTGANTDIKHHMDHLLTEGFTQVSMVPIFGHDDLLTHEDTKEFIRQYRKLIEYAREQVAQGNATSLRGYGNLMSDLAKLHGGGRKTHACGAGTTLLGVDIRGNLYPCHRFVGELGFVLGSVFQGFHNEPEFYTVERFQDETLLDNMGKCATCFARAFCAGGCYHNNWVMTSQVALSPYKQCMLVKSTFKELLLLYSSISHEDKVSLLGKSPLPDWAVGRSSAEILTHKATS